MDARIQLRALGAFKWVLSLRMCAYFLVKKFFFTSLDLNVRFSSLSLWVWASLCTVAAKRSTLWADPLSLTPTLALIITTASYHIFSLLLLLLLLSPFINGSVDGSELSEVKESRYCQWAGYCLRPRNSSSVTTRSIQFPLLSAPCCLLVSSPIR